MATKRKRQVNDNEWKRQCVPRTETNNEKPSDTTPNTNLGSSSKQEEPQKETHYGGCVYRVEGFDVRAYKERKTFLCTSILDETKAKALAETYLQQLKIKHAPYVTTSTVRRVSHWRVSINKQSKRVSKAFSDAVYGSSAKAKEAAEDYMRQQSNHLGITTRRIADVPEDFRRYMAGFCDGDGCISLHIQNNSHTVQVEFGQSRNESIPPVLNRLQSYYGGGITSNTKAKRRRTWQRTAWRLIIHGHHAEKILIDLVNFCVLKHQQAEIALNCVRARGNMTYDFKTSQTQLCLLKNEYMKAELQASQISLPFLAGFFDAEGYIGLTSTLCLRAMIAQKSCPPLLYMITAFLSTLGVSSSVDKDEKVVVLYGGEVDKLCKLLLPFVIVKKPQLKLGIEFRALQLNNDKSDRKKEISAEMKRLKRV